MGLYINPDNDWSDGAKERWLGANGIKLSSMKQLNFNYQFVTGNVIVCLVDNGPFTAAIVCYDERELTRAREGVVGRNHIWYSVPRDLVLEVCPDLPQFEQEGELD